MFILKTPYSVCMTGMQMVLKQALAIGYTAFTSFTDNNSTDNTSCLGGKWCDAVQKFTRSLNSGAKLASKNK